MPQSIKPAVTQLDPCQTLSKEVDIVTPNGQHSINNIKSPPGKPLNPKEAASYLGLTESTLATYRCRGGGPFFLRAGNRIRYRLADLNAWMEQGAGTTAAQARLNRRQASLKPEG